MSYGTIYECIAYDRLNNGIGIYIQKLDYSGAISKMILDADPIEIKYNREKRVYGTGAIVNILNDFDDKYLFAKMLANPYETYKLLVVSNGNTIFEGFLLPQTFNQDVRYKSYVALTFGNGLRMLENITPSFLTTGTDDYITEMDILINIFSYLNLDYTIYVNSTLYEDSMSAGERDDNPLKATYLNRLAFQQNDGEWDDALTILNKILTSINADCYIRGERIMIERFVDRDNNPKTFFGYFSFAWFLPSKNLLTAMYTNLKAEGVGGFTERLYWSSSEFSATHASTFYFFNGTDDQFGKGSGGIAVRACHSFTAAVGAYELRDTGPAGGLICYIDGTTFYEAAPSDQSISKAWSNITDVAIGTTGTAIGTGQANTDAIIAQDGHTDSAAKLCNDFYVGGDVEETFTDKTLDHIVLSAKSFRYQIDQPIKKLKLKLNPLTFNNIFANDFDKNIEHASMYYLFYWAYSQYIAIINTNFSNAFITRGIDISKHPEDSWETYGNSTMRYQGIFFNPSDEVVFNLKFKCWSRSIGIPTGWALNFVYTVTLVTIPGGTIHYICTDGTLSTGGTGKEILTSTIENNGEDHKYDFSIDKTFDLTGLLDTVGLDGDSYVRINIHPPRRSNIGEGVYAANAIGGVYGDFSLNQDNIGINNLLEADLNNDAFKTIEEELSLYDTGYINYKASKLLKVTNGYQSTASWTDGINTSKSLQDHYILNRGNLYNSSCAILNMTIIDPDVEVNIDDIFVFNNLEDDLGNPMKFYVDDLSFNVKKHIYNLKLKQWLTDVGKDIVYE